MQPIFTWMLTAGRVYLKIYVKITMGDVIKYALPIVQGLPIAVAILDMSWEQTTRIAMRSIIVRQVMVAALKFVRLMDQACHIALVLLDMSYWLMAIHVPF